MARLLTKYKDEVIATMMESFSFKNQMAVPKLEKIVVHMGVGKAIDEDKRLTEASETMATITGQKARVCRAKAPIAGFHLREGQAIGLKATIRGRRMYEFLDRLVSAAIPRIKDFRGLSPRSFDGGGNYNFGITEHIVFPETNADFEFTQGMDITIVVSNSSGEKSLRLLRELGMPFADMN
tara:strand:- start:1002 stop:1544 length:543 start_codon:yes stop_codon:yes gene_type:complete